MRHRACLLGLIATFMFVGTGCSLLGGSQTGTPPGGAPGTGGVGPTSTPSATSAPSATTSPTPSGGAPTNGKVTLKYKSKVGQTLKYRVRSRIVNDAVVNGKRQKFTMSQVIVFSHKTIKIAGNGDSTVRLTYKSATAKINARSVKLPLTGKTITLIVSSSGQVKKIKSLGGVASSEGEDYRRIADDVPAPLPDKPVGPGDTWTTTADIPLPDGSGTLSMTNTYTLAGFRKVGGQRAAVVRSKFTSPSRITLTKPHFVLDVESQTRGSGVEYFAVDSGRMLKSSGTALVRAQESFHASGLGLPWVNSTNRIRVSVSADLIR